MIRIQNLRRTLAGQHVLRGIDLVIDTGETVALVGPSGTGKSILLRHIIGLMIPDGGDVLIDGRSIVRAGYNELRRLRRRMGYVFQDGALLDAVDVAGNLRLALDDAECARNPLHEPTRVAYALRMVNLDKRVLKRLPAELSGGMRKRVGVARAILNSPDIMLYDEPTTGLDPQNVAAVNELIVRTRDALGATSIVITHDLQGLPYLADRVAFLRDGTIHFTGTPSKFLESNDPAVVAFVGNGPVSPRKEASWPTISAVASQAGSAA
jgi:phospholipid/cholesterol/gamma-HCH transport system ATP-binding protein